MQDHQKPDGQPKRWSEDDVSIIKEQQDLEDGRGDFVFLAISEISGEIPHEALVKAVIEVLWLRPDSENQVLCG